MINDLLAGLAVASSVVAQVPAPGPNEHPWETLAFLSLLNVERLDDFSPLPQVQASNQQRDPWETLAPLSLSNVMRLGVPSPLDTFSWSLDARSSDAVANAWISQPMEPVRSVLAEPSWANAQVGRLSEAVEAALFVASPEPISPPLPFKAPRTALDETICSLNVVDWELGKVLQALSLQTQANLILQAPSDTKLTINLSNVALADMLRHICAVTSLEFIRVDRAYIVASADKLAAGYPSEWLALHPKVEPVPVPKVVVVTRIYMANFVRSNQIVETLKSVFEGQGLNASGGPSQVSPKIASRDTATVTGVAAGTVSTAANSDTVSRLVILRGPEDVVNAALEVAKAIDTSRPQVAIAVTIHDISNEALKELGLSWTFGDVAISESSPGKGLNFGSFTRASQSFSATISALEKSDKARLLASPNISVLDGEQAFILIGSRINYPVLIGYTQNNTPIFDKETEKVGIYLQVAASVSDKNEITLSLYPQVSTITGFLQVNGASYPQIATREAQTTLRVSTGQTIVMGGLLRDEEITNMEKVPLLSDIPILGELFKRRKTTKTSSQVIIAITPVVIPPKDQ